MTTAFTFPGQGSQYIGMGKELAEAFPEAKDVFQEVDDVLSQKLSAMMWDGDIADLNMTENTQPALIMWQDIHWGNIRRWHVRAHFPCPMRRVF